LLFAGAGFTGEADVQVQAEGAAVQLGDPHVDQFQHRSGHAGLLGGVGDLEREPVQGPPACRVGLIEKEITA
jgi:hypothetical protein